MKMKAHPGPRPERLTELSAWMITSGYTNSQVADAVGVSVKSVGRYRHGGRVDPFRLLAFKAAYPGAPINDDGTQIFIAPPTQTT